MNTTKLKKDIALAGECIRHWKENANAERPAIVETASNACAFCNAYFVDDCDGCPIASAGHRHCKGTPYYAVLKRVTDWMLLAGEGSDAFERLGNRCREACLQEVAFLEEIEAGLVAKLKALEGGAR